jgi:hypothetical protein
VGGVAADAVTAGAAAAGTVTPPDIELITAGGLFGGNRESVRRASVQRALELVLQFETRAAAVSGEHER